MVRILKSWWLPPGSSFEALTGISLPPELPLDPTTGVLNLPWTPEGEARLRARLLAIRQGAAHRLLHNQKLIALDAFARAWLETENPDRQAYLHGSCLLTGLSEPLLEARLTPFLKALTLPVLRPALAGLLQLPAALDGFVMDPQSSLLRMAQGPALLTVEGAERPPERLLLEVVRGILLGAAVLVRAGETAALLGPLLLDALGRVEPQLVQAVALLRPLSLTDATDDSETSQVRPSSPMPSTAGAGREARVGPGWTGNLPQDDSVAPGPVVLVLRSALRDPKLLLPLARAITKEVALHEGEAGGRHQTLFVERGGVVSIRAFAEALSAAMAEWNLVLPPRRLKPARKARIRSRLSLIELHHLLGSSEQVVSPLTRLQGAVVIEAPSLKPLDWQERTLRVMPIGHWTELIRLVDARAQEQWLALSRGVAVAGEGFAFDQVRLALVSRGVRLLCAPGHLLQPSLLWHQLEPSSWESLVTWHWEDPTLTLEEVELHELEEADSGDGVEDPLIQEESALLGRPKPLPEALALRSGRSSSLLSPLLTRTTGRKGGQSWDIPVIHLDMDRPEEGEVVRSHATFADQAVDLPDEPLPAPEAPPRFMELRRTDKMHRPLSNASPGLTAVELEASGNPESEGSVPSGAPPEGVSPEGVSPVGVSPEGVSRGSVSAPRLALAGRAQAVREPPGSLDALPTHFRRHVPAKPPPLAMALLEDAEDLPEITLGDVLIPHAAPASAALTDS